MASNLRSLPRCSGRQAARDGQVLFVRSLQELYQLIALDLRRIRQGHDTLALGVAKTDRKRRGLTMTMRQMQDLERFASLFQALESGDGARPIPVHDINELQHPTAPAQTVAVDRMRGGEIVPVVEHGNNDSKQTMLGHVDSPIALAGDKVLISKSNRPRLEPHERLVAGGSRAVDKRPQQPQHKNEDRERPEQHRDTSGNDTARAIRLQKVPKREGHRRKADHRGPDHPDA